MADLRQRLLTALAQKGWSQAQLAGAIEVSAAAVSAWCSGQKKPSVGNLRLIAEHLGVTPSYLQFGEGEGRGRDLAAERDAYRNALEWYWRPAPPDGGRELGNPAGFAFHADVATLAREAAQNSLDETVPGEPTVNMRFIVSEISGKALQTFLSAIRFDDVRPHLMAASASGQKASIAISNGLRRLDEDERLVLLKIEDYGANGLLGPEYDSGQYMAVVRNILDSFKRDNAGGSYGLGKATLSATSQFGLVLINSTLSEAEDGLREGRFIGRMELPWRDVPGEGAFAGPGWLGVRDPKRDVTRSYWGNAAVAADTLLERSNPEPGTSFCIVSAYDPSGDAETIEEIADALRRSMAANFWPAMVEGSDDTPARLTAVVRAERNGRTLTEHFVDPEQYQPAKAAALRRYFNDQLEDALEKPGDVVRETITLKVPRRTNARAPHPSHDHEAILLVAQAEDTDDAANHVAFMRGSRMVIHEPHVTGLPVGARSFHAIVLAGEASGDAAADRAAERFLRAAEPPAHNRWTSTSELTNSYVRGGPSAIRRFEDEVRRRIRELVKQRTIERSDGPDALKELLRLLPPKPESSSRPKIKALRGALTEDGAWSVEATITLPSARRGWSLLPVIGFGTETGSPIRVRWRDLAVTTGGTLQDGRIVTEAGTRTVKFTGTSDPASHPVSAHRATAFVDVRAGSEAASP